ncbi:sporulation inhibitor of replication protein SirA [Siminovitchia fortis]|uniref:Sporulation inhibitor of replication protein SirA n=1 Tax=Siminovitchia fortis TaxID=254758 RepID=A0A443IUA9_9BACI|nr:sporulation inhibitor of replication protein SirA [Siminovitchia fortis]RWR11661.1 sporulation inhibitor of replication protein SirA [Siminovitchia fortis]WHY83210.1 sporulation inhibitor of replication protein SirA [Siminovitchia fortis]
MRTYFIYMIKDEFADYFYGRESRFFQLFAGSHSADGNLKEIIHKQIDYITEPLPYLDLHKLFSQFVQNQQIYIKGKVYCMGQAKDKDGAELAIEEDWLQLNAWGGFESETIFFEVLRKFDGHFFAVDIENERYGWVKPVKERKYI